MSEKKRNLANGKIDFFQYSLPSHISSAKSSGKLLKWKVNDEGRDRIAGTQLSLIKVEKLVRGWRKMGNSPPPLTYMFSVLPTQKLALKSRLFIQSLTQNASQLNFN